MYKMSLVHLRIKSRQTCQHLHIGNHTKALNKIIYIYVMILKEHSECYVKPQQTKPKT